MSRDLTTKGLSRRLHSEYSSNRPFRRRVFIVSGIGVLLLGAAWAALSATNKTRAEAMYQPGPVSFVHRTFANECDKCHETWRSTPDDKCQSCHSSRGHHSPKCKLLKLSNAACSECHSEHRHVLRPPPPPDAKCVKCHRNLTQHATPDLGKVSVKDSITNFNTDHPEFGIISSGGKDPAHLSFNHGFHLNKTIRQKKIGTGAMSEQFDKQVEKFLDDSGLEREVPPRNALACTDCHMLDQSSRLFEPVKYEQHCKSCHGLNFDLADPTGKNSTEPLPHEDPEAVHRFLTAKFAEKQEAALAAPGAPKNLNPMQVKAQMDWVKNKVHDVEQGLQLAGTCKKCHDVEDEKATLSGPPPSKLFSIVPTDITRQWLPHAWFSHTAHREMKCEECHSQIPISEKTEDVNLPNIARCKDCHVGSGGARSDCAECHLYHDKKNRARQEGKMSTLPSPGH